MPTVREITIRWAAVNTPGGTTVLHCDNVITAPNQRTAINNFLQAMKTQLHAFTVATIATTGREFDAATGVLTGAWTDSTPYITTGTGAGNPVPNSSQILLQLFTGTVVGGRFLRGRTFIPGAIATSNTDGQVNAAAQSAIRTPAAAMAAAAGLVVWKRPISGGPAGTAVPVSSVAVASEYAVLRRRR